MIDENLNPIDRRTLRMSSKVCKSMLRPLSPQDSIEDKIHLTCLMEQDWLKLPTHQICTVCLEPHERLMAQPRAFERQFKYTHANHRICKGGLRLTADRVLCQCCWNWSILNQEQRGVTHERHFWDFNNTRNSWKHGWSTEWREVKLLLAMMTELYLDELGGIVEWLMKYLKTSNFMQSMVRVPFCRCKSTHSILEQEIKRRTGTYLSDRLSSWRKRWEISQRSYLDCVWCGALYTVGWSDDKLIVTRYYDLNSPEAMAASIHWEVWSSFWQVSRSWKDVGMRTWFQWRLSCMTGEIRRVCGVSRTM